MALGKKGKLFQFQINSVHIFDNIPKRHNNELYGVTKCGPRGHIQCKIPICMTTGVGGKFMSCGTIEMYQLQLLDYVVYNIAASL